VPLIVISAVGSCPEGSKQKLSPSPVREKVLPSVAHHHTAINALFVRFLSVICHLFVCLEPVELDVTDAADPQPLCRLIALSTLTD
jgi:hypothetical protein